MSSPTNSLFSSAWSYGSNALTAVASIVKPAPKSEFLDIGEALIGLALLIFRDPKTKISIHEHELHRDHYYASLNVQGGKRLLYGGTHEELHNLTAPLFYAAVWLNPAENEDIKIVFDLAKQGLQQLITHAYEGDFQTQQYLHCVHLRILKEALEGKNLCREDYLIPNWDDNPLAEASKDFWTAEDSPMETIAEIFAKALHRKEKELDFKHQIESIKEETRAANEKMKSLFEKIKSGK